MHTCMSKNVVNCNSVTVELPIRAQKQKDKVVKLQNSQHFDIYSNICGVLTFAAFLCS